MCVLLVHLRTRDDAPVVLLANRDEAFSRAFDPPTLRPGPEGIVAPRDHLAGGTWLGTNAAGLVVAITNRPAPPAPPGTRSRGLLVFDLLKRRSAAEAEAWLAGHLAKNRYAPFNLMVLDRERGTAVHHGADPAERRRGRTLATERLGAPLAPGVHVLTNLHDLDVAPVPPEGDSRADEPLAELVARLERLAGDRTTPLPGDHRICKVGRTRGTVCSAVVVVPADPARRPWMRFAAGPPHVTPFVDAP
jgi:hypothetical protein